MRLCCSDDDGVNTVVTLLHSMILFGGNRRSGRVGSRCRLAAGAGPRGASDGPARSRQRQPVSAGRRLAARTVRTFARGAM